MKYYWREELEDELSWEDIQRLTAAFIVCILGTAAHKGFSKIEFLKKKLQKKLKLKYFQSSRLENSENLKLSRSFLKTKTHRTFLILRKSLSFNKTSIKVRYFGRQCFSSQFCCAAFGGPRTKPIRLCTPWPRRKRLKRNTSITTSFEKKFFKKKASKN